MAVAGLYTEVRNVSGVTRTFGFLGRRGARLANDEAYSVPGDLVAALAAGNMRKFKALERAAERGDLLITKSPAVYLTDADDGSVDQLALDTNAVTTTAPEGF
jgi:hypothetical protein